MSASTHDIDPRQRRGSRSVTKTRVRSRRSGFPQRPHALLQSVARGAAGAARNRHPDHNRGALRRPDRRDPRRSSAFRSKIPWSRAPSASTSSGTPRPWPIATRRCIRGCAGWWPPSFAPRKIDEMEPAVRAMVSRLLDSVAGQADFDTVKVLGDQLPMMVFGHMLNVPGKRLQRHQETRGRYPRDRRAQARQTDLRPSS